MKEESFLRQKRLREGAESPEVFRASIGFDFVFTNDEQGNKRCLCIEFNGADSGIAGLQDIPAGRIDRAHRVVTRVRGMEDPEKEALRHKTTRLLTEIHSPEFQISRTARDSIHTVWMAQYDEMQMFPHAYSTPPVLDALAADKLAQVRVIEARDRPRTFKSGESTRSVAGYWVAKPRYGRGGKGIEILTDSELKAVISESRDSSSDLYGIFEDTVFQEYVESVGADTDHTEAGASVHPASMRYLVDFRYLQDETVRIDGEYAYQRISHSSVRSDERPDVEVVVVNKSRGAAATEASRDEIDRAREVSQRIIANLAKYYRFHRAK